MLGLLSGFKWYLCIRWAGCLCWNSAAGLCHPKENYSKDYSTIVVYLLCYCMGLQIVLYLPATEVAALLSHYFIPLLIGMVGNEDILLTARADCYFYSQKARTDKLLNLFS